MTKRISIEVQGGPGGFAEDKDRAKRVRVETILPALERNQTLVLDFSSIRYATQSYVHALIGEALKRYGEPALKRIEFKNCSPAVRSVIELVVDYSLGGFPEPEAAQAV